MSESMLVEESPNAGREFPARPGVSLGREGCDVVLSDPEVSRRHAALRESASGLAVEDLDSTNGTFVNDMRVTGVVALNDGDKVRVGDTVLRLKLAAPEPVRAAPLPAAEAAPGAEAAPAAAGERRGDVPRPSQSAIMPALPLPQPDSPPAFETGTHRRFIKGSAARSTVITIYAFAVVLLDFVALAIYFGAR